VPSCRNRSKALLVGLLALLAASAGCGGGGGKAGVTLTQIGSFEEPVYAVGYGDVIYVVERAGTVRSLVNGTETDHTLLDVSDRVKHHYYEDGLLSIACRGRLCYVYYSNKDGLDELDEFVLKEDDPTRVEPGSRSQVLLIPRKKDEHNGGQLEFGPDGYLYISVGDGGAPEEAQDPGSLRGKLLRIDPRPSGDQPYTVPKSNPYVGSDGRDEVYALGFRNPWRFSFDRSTDAITIGDVGDVAWEEIDYEPRGQIKGANFGWPLFEGDHPYRSEKAPSPPPGYEPPIHEYPHAAHRCTSLTGGYVVRDPRLDALAGRYVYGDYCSGELRSLVPEPGGARDDEPLGINVPNLTSLGEDSQGHVYVASLGGAVYRLDPT
jgi:glucose/arabinose dehydrogenase